MTTEIKWSYSPYPQIPRYKTTGIVRFDDHYGVSKLDGRDNRSNYRFGVEINDELLQGTEAYESLLQPIWGENGETFLDLIPDFIAPIKWIFNPDWQPESGIPQLIINPEYPQMCATWEAAKIEMLGLLHDKLKLICKVTFPAVKDTGNLIQWFQKMGELWYEIPVEVGKYPQVNKFVTVLEYNHPQYGGYMNFVTACGVDKDKIVKVLLQIPDYVPQTGGTGAGSTTINPGGGTSSGGGIT